MTPHAHHVNHLDHLSTIARNNDVITTGAIVGSLMLITWIVFMITWRYSEMSIPVPRPPIFKPPPLPPPVVPIGENTIAGRTFEDWPVTTDRNH